jgi:hypothetical protein
MQCRNCNTQIADNALICYRCGRATSDPKVKPPSEGSIFAHRRRQVAMDHHCDHCSPGNPRRSGFLLTGIYN